MTCPTCEELRREVERLRRIDWRSWRDAAQRLVEHQTRDHCLHVATVDNKSNH